jgi:chromosome segregation ATPase
MPEEPTQTPESSPDTGNTQQANGGTAGTTNQSKSDPLQGYVPEARLTGALQKINELTLTIKSLNDQLKAANTRVGELQAQAQSKETEWSTKVGESSQALQGVTGERDNLKAENARLQAELEKAKMVGEMGHYNLLPILDQIPSDTDPEKQKANITRMAKWADDMLAQREQALTTGQTNTTTQPNTTVTGGGETTPKTPKQWETYIESLPYGSPERTAAWDQYWEQLQGQKPAQA